MLSAFVVHEAGRYRYRTSDHPQLPVRLAMLRKASEMGWLNGRRDSTMLQRAGSVLCATQNTDSFDADSLSVCAVLECLVSIRAGTCRASTTFYPCRLAASHLISHAPLGAGDASYERAKSVCL